MPEKLSCIACRESKIKCSKERPTCNKCAQKGAECVYRPRAPRRRRKSQIASGLDRLTHPEDNGNSKRLFRELLPRTHSPVEPIPALLVPHLVASTDSREYLSSPDAISSRNPTTHSPSPFGSWQRDTTDTTSLTSINELPSLGLDKSTAQKWIDRALKDELFERFLALVDLNIMKAMPGILDSGYAQFEPSVMIIYYNLVIHGSLEIKDPAGPYWRRRLFEQCRSISPDFTQMQTLTDTDFSAAFLMLWTCIAIFDNVFRWHMFCQASHIATRLGWHDLEASPSDTIEEEVSKQDTRRILFWQLLRIESWFRVFHDKPPVLTARTWNTSLPSLSIESTEGAVGATLATVCMVHARLTLIIIDCFKVLDDPTKTQGEVRNSLKDVIKEAQELLRDWEIEDSFRSVIGFKHRMYYADTLLFNYGLVIELTQRLGIHANPNLHRDARHCSRRMLRAMLDFADAEMADTNNNSVALSIVGGNTFSPFFTLRQAAIDDLDRDTARTDFALLQAFAGMVQAGVRAQGFVTVEPFAAHLVEMSRVSNINIGGGWY